MIVKTKKYQLSTKKYIKLGMLNILRSQWWVILITLAIGAMTFVIPSNWWWIGSLTAFVLYGLFWLIQFAGVPQLEQNKILFERLNYEITSQQILIKLNPKQGMPMKWENIKKAFIGKDFFLLIISKAQFIYLPFKIFNSDNERKFMETILRRSRCASASPRQPDLARQSHLTAPVPCSEVEFHGRGSCSGWPSMIMFQA